MAGVPQQVNRATLEGGRKKIHRELSASGLLVATFILAMVRHLTRD
jgi:hypothetical protein